MKHTETLIFFDAPQLIVAKDILATNYLCLLVETGVNKDKYFCIPISPGKLQDFKMGEVDLLSILKNPEVDNLFEALTNEGQYDELNAKPIESSDVPNNWLPDPGFYLTSLRQRKQGIVKEAQERYRAVLHYTLNPPEAKDESKISAIHLSQATKLFQRLVKHSYRKAIKDLPYQEREQISDELFYRLDVFAFSKGSFTVHMQSGVTGDLVGYVHISKALEIIDNITALIDDPEEATKKLAEVGGHFASAYKNLIQFISNSSIPLNYEWSMPEKNTSTFRSISTHQAKPLYEHLSKRVDLGKEDVILKGRLTKVDDKYGSWRLKNIEDGKEYSGKIDPDSNINLAGAVIETKVYKFICEERLEEEAGTGRESSTLYLVSYEIE